MTDRVFRLKASKKSLYELVKRHFDMQVKQQSTEFIKHHRTRSYSLNFIQDGVWHHFLFSVAGGDPVLGHEIKLLDEEGEPIPDWSVEDIPLRELRELGLVEEI